MHKAHIYPVKNPHYDFMVKFERKGFKPYRRYFKTEEEAQVDCDKFNDKLLIEGREGQHIGPRERKQLLELIDVLKAKKMTIKDVIKMIEEVPEVEKRIECRKALQNFLISKDKLGRSYETQKELRNRITAFLDECKKEYIDQIEISDLKEYIFRSVSPTTQRNDRTALGNFFNYLVEIGYIEKSPIDKVGKPSRPRHESVAILRPSEAQIWFWRLEKKYPQLVSYYAIALFAGLRPSEIHHLGKTDMTANGIKVTGGKMRGRKRRVVPRTAVLDRWLAKYPPSFKWPSVDTTSQKSARKLCPRKWKPDLPRHTYISCKMAQTKNHEKQVALWAGNSSDEIYSSYFETMEPAKADLFDSLKPKSEAKITPGI